MISEISKVTKNLKILTTAVAVSMLYSTEVICLPSTVWVLLQGLAGTMGLVSDFWKVLQTYPSE